MLNLSLLKTSYKYLIALGILMTLFSASPAYAQEPQTLVHFEHTTWKEVLAKAAQENKPIYLDAYASWCGPCKWMVKHVFTDSAVADFYNTHFINVQVDMEKGEGPALAEQYGVKAYPTMLYLDGKGNILHRTCGSAEAKDFIAAGNTALDPKFRLAAYKDAFDKGEASPDMVLKYLDMLDKGCSDDVNDVADEYLRKLQLEQLLMPDNWSILEKYVTDMHASQFGVLLNYQPEFEKRVGTEKVNNKIYNVYLSSALKIAKSSQTDEAKYQELKKELSTTNFKRAKEIIVQADMAWYARQKNWDRFAQSTINYMDTYPTTDPVKLNSLAWDFFEHVTNKAQLDKALAWAQLSVKLQDKSYNNDTYANLLFKLGRKSEAIKVEEKAAQLAAEAKEDTTPYKETIAKFKKG